MIFHFLFLRRLWSIVYLKLQYREFQGQTKLGVEGRQPQRKMSDKLWLKSYKTFENNMLHFIFPISKMIHRFGLYQDIIYPSFIYLSGFV